MGSFLQDPSGVFPSFSSDDEDLVLVDQVDFIIGISEPVFDLDKNPNTKFFLKLKNKNYANCIWVGKNTLESIPEFKNNLIIPFKNWLKASHLSKVPFMQGLYKPSEIPFRKEFFEEEKILCVCEKNAKNYYLIKWKFLPITEATWESSAPIELINEYSETVKILNHIKLQNIEIFKNPKNFSKLKNRKFSFKEGNKPNKFQFDGYIWMIDKWLNNHNSIIADKDENSRKIEIIIFLMNLIQITNFHGPFLILTQIENVNEWESLFSKLTNFRVINYTGTENALEMILKNCVFYENNSNFLKVDVIISCFDTFKRKHSDFYGIEWVSIIIDEKFDKMNFHQRIFKILQQSHFDNLIFSVDFDYEKFQIPDIFNLLNFLESDTFYNYSDFCKTYCNKINNELPIQEMSNKSIYELNERFQIIENNYILMREMPMINPFTTNSCKKLIYEVEPTEIQLSLIKTLFVKNKRLFFKEDYNLKKKDRMKIIHKILQISDHPLMLNSMKNDQNSPNIVNSCGKMIFLDKIIAFLRKQEIKILILVHRSNMISILEEYLKSINVSYQKLQQKHQINEENKEKIDSKDTLTLEETNIHQNLNENQNESQACFKSTTHNNKNFSIQPNFNPNSNSPSMINVSKKSKQTNLKNNCSNIQTNSNKKRKKEKENQQNEIMQNEGKKRREKQKKHFFVYLAKFNFDEEDKAKFNECSYIIFYNDVKNEFYEKPVFRLVTRSTVEEELFQNYKGKVEYFLRRSAINSFHYQIDKSFVIEPIDILFENRFMKPIEEFSEVIENPDFWKYFFHEIEEEMLSNKGNIIKCCFLWRKYGFFEGSLNHFYKIDINFPTVIPTLYKRLIKKVHNPNPNLINYKSIFNSTNKLSIYYINALKVFNIISDVISDDNIEGFLTDAVEKDILYKILQFLCSDDFMNHQIAFKFGESMEVPYFWNVFNDYQLCYNVLKNNSFFERNSSLTFLKERYTLLINEIPAYIPYENIFSKSNKINNISILEPMKWKRFYHPDPMRIQMESIGFIKKLLRVLFLIGFDEQNHNFIDYFMEVLSEPKNLYPNIEYTLYSILSLCNKKYIPHLKSIENTLKLNQSTSQISTATETNNCKSAITQNKIVNNEYLTNYSSFSINESQTPTNISNHDSIPSNDVTNGKIENNTITNNENKTELNSHPNVTEITKELERTPENTDHENPNFTREIQSNKSEHFSLDLSWIPPNVIGKLKENLEIFEKLRFLKQSNSFRPIDAWLHAPKWWDFECDTILINTTIKFGLHHISPLSEIKKTKCQLSDEEKEEVQKCFEYEKLNLTPKRPAFLKDFQFLENIDFRINRLKELIISGSMSNLQMLLKSQKIPTNVLTGVSIIRFGQKNLDGIPIGFNSIRFFYTQNNHNNITTLNIYECLIKLRNETKTGQNGKILQNDDILFVIQNDKLKIEENSLSKAYRVFLERIYEFSLSKPPPHFSGFDFFGFRKLSHIFLCE
ncbi:hypothetical protein TRFO_23917 [Tritrichomonas foetus]|uniref:Chromo domain-containing protein n=1 Tax=Tritrichomonas foetus TaxID=1144522 RepID=A0A1J4KA01_9EUKA|nr:hypothetical protein TRFO_23917 [Tritrichomonas foetus]|eukprot:OHT07744.1 hypothetical protein TRFO_23917 [Tritrichomonas foetus]